MFLLIILIGKIISLISRIFNIGNGETWPGEIALKLNPLILRRLTSGIKKGIIIITGTNGKTTTSLMISKILDYAGFQVVTNLSGANLLNGLISSLLKNYTYYGKLDKDYAVFEVDENSLPQILQQVNPRILVILNLFRDQLDRYGEVDTIVDKWKIELANLNKNTSLILNCDDPQVAMLAKFTKARVSFFGLEDTSDFIHKIEHATDSIFCLNCHKRLSYRGIFYSHLGHWYCVNCQEKRPSPHYFKTKEILPGKYNLYNYLAVIGIIKTLNIKESYITKALKNFSPAFGRQEKFTVNGKKIIMFLSKNPVSFNESLKTVIKLGAKKILFILNDRIPDGKDVSWIWDVDFEMIPGSTNVIVTGDRVYDLALRMKHTKIFQNSNIVNLTIEPILKKALEKGMDSIYQKDTLYILTTYSAMLEARKILIGRKIL